MYSHAVLTFAMLSCPLYVGLDCGARSCCAELGRTNLLDLAVVLVTQTGLLLQMPMRSCQLQWIPGS